VAARGDAGVGDDFLEAVEHGRKLSVISFQCSVKQRLDRTAESAPAELHK
jgi:hypothetical protein